jgi:hypothetical protein
MDVYCEQFLRLQIIAVDGNDIIFGSTKNYAGDPPTETKTPPNLYKPLI